MRPFQVQRRCESPVVREYRLITGGIGHDLPQEAPRAFAQAVMDADGLAR